MRKALRAGRGVSAAVSRLARSRLAITGQIAQPWQATARGAPVGGFPRLKLAARTWWSDHPAHLVLDLATPVVSKYTGRSPWWFLAGAATSGAVVAKVRPWRLLSLSGLLAIAKSSQLPSLLLSALTALDVPEGANRRMHSRRGQALTRCSMPGSTKG